MLHVVLDSMKLTQLPIFVPDLQSVVLELIALLAQHSITSQELAKYLHFFKGNDPPLVCIPLQKFLIFSDHNISYSYL